MSKTETNQRLLNWLNNEKKKDDLQEKSYKNKIVEEIKGLKKEEMFQKPKKLSLWTKIKVMILGN
jgi:hypothetical protein